MAAPLLVVDTPSMLFRAFYALPSSIKGPDGNPVNALLGTANLILREVERHARGRSCSARAPTPPPTGPSSTRPTTPTARRPSPTTSAPSGRTPATSSRAFGWTIAETDSYEADDLLGSYADKETKAGGRTLIMTGDRDMFQCASGKVKVLYVSTGGKQGGELIGPAEVKERYGIPPKLVPDFIALRGDPSDGLPGAKGVGEKGAAELLRKHGSLEKLLDNAFRETRPKLRQALVEQREELLAFKEIATLREVKVGPSPQQATDYRSAAKAARERGMNRLAERLEQAARG